MPDVSQVHIDVALTNVSVAYRNTDYIADAVAPPIAVRKQSDKYFIYDPHREFLRATPDARAPGAEASEVDFQLSTDSYFCEDHALEAAIPDEERENADPPLQPDIDRAEMLADKIALNREIALETLLRTSGAISGVSLDPVDWWSVPTSDPLAQLREARQVVFSAAQRRPNVAILPYAVFDALRHHPQIVERIKYTTAGIIGEELLAQLLDLDRVLVPRAFKNVARRGQAPACVPVWGNTAWLLYVPPRPALKQVMAVGTFVWSGAMGAVDGWVVERWREPRRKADMIRVQRYYDHKLIAPTAIYRIQNVIESPQ
ncbi:MAG: major capsid protein [Candidatus Sumerlaeaceae bacterium]|nr:major capsid protein [Candidatus Sumerlaeaceae bacterium]